MPEYGNRNPFSRDSVSIANYSAQVTRPLEQSTGIFTPGDVPLSGGVIGAPWVGAAVQGNVIGSNVTSVTVDVSGATDEEIVWIIGIIGDAEPSLITAPAGWTLYGQISEGVTGGSSSQTVIFYKVKASTDTTVTITDATNWTLAAKPQFVPVSWPGVNTTTPAEGLTWLTRSAGLATTYDTGTATPTLADRWAVGVFSSRGSSATAAWTPDAAQTSRTAVINTATAFIGLLVADTNAAVTAAAHVYTATGQSASHGTGAVFFLIPAAAATGASLTQAPTDNLGLTDSVSINQDKSATDNLGLTDSISINQSKGVTDNLGLTDTPALSLDKVVTDNLGLTDSVVIDKGIAVSVTDTQGLADTTVFDLGKGIADPLGLTDAIAFDISIVITDNMGLTDPVTVDKSITQTAVDNLGLTDAVTLATGYGRAPTDPEGLTDTRAISLGKVTTDNLGLTETRAITVGKGVTDSEGLTDAASLGLDKATTDNLGLTDSVSITFSASRIFSDTTGLTDDVSVVLISSVLVDITIEIGPSRIATDIGLSRIDTVDVGVTRARVQADVGLSRVDTADVGVTRSRVQADVGSTRQGLDVGQSRQGIDIGVSRKDR